MPGDFLIPELTARKTERVLTGGCQENSAEAAE
jgi:hypothetical protein